MYKKIFFALIHCFFTTLWAQDVPIGQFKEYLSYNKFHCVAQDDENVYAATSHSILVVDKHDKSLEKWSKINGLSEVGVQTLHADRKGRLIIVYKNANIDVIKDYKVHNIRDILNKQLTGSKTINHIFTSEDIAYFSCDFGVVILDLRTLLVKDSWLTIRQNESYRARFLTIHNQHYYLATDKGVFSLPITAPNAADFSTWKRESELSTSSYKLLCSYQNRLFAVQDDGVDSRPDSLFVYENSHWKPDNSLRTNHFRSFEVIDDKLMICSWNHVKIFSGNNYIQYLWESPLGNVDRNGRVAIWDKKTNIWVADNNLGLVHIDTKTEEHKIITAAGPANNEAGGLYFTEGDLAVVPGARNPNLTPNWNTPGAISVLNNDQWWSYAVDYRQFSKGLAFNSVVINPLNKNELYMASWVGGLFKIDKTTNKIDYYDSSNSPLVSARSNGAVFLSGLAIDKQNYLWMAHSESANQIKVKNLNTTEDEWHTLNWGISGADVIVEHILIDSRNYRWATALRQNQLFVFRGTLDNIERREVDIKSQATIAGNRVTCIAEDREGRIWIGGDQGIRVIYDAASVFSKSDRATFAKNILIKQEISSNEEGYWQHLLESEHITCITVDAADRKWIGTQNAGVFLVSPSGTQQLFHFTTDNSPLFSNQINDIKINPENGEVFIATAEGLLSYKGTATAGRADFKEVLVYPNPVRENYFGPIAVRGLMEDALCKITDAAGNLVWQGIAYGGQLIWDGKDFYGNRPATGVYFVMASSKTGKEKKVAKFLFVQ